MAFDPNNLSYGEWLNTYSSPTDTMIEISETDYFSLASGLELGDMIILKSSDDDGGIYKVTQVTPAVTIAKI